MGLLLTTSRVNTTRLNNTLFNQEVMHALARYKKHDWGDMSEGDKEMNDEAVKNGNDRILAAYNTHQGKIYIITEHDRSATTVLFAEEY